MTMIKDRVFHASLLCAVIVILLAVQGCQRAVSVPPKAGSEAQTATEKMTAPPKPDQAKVVEKKADDKKAAEKKPQSSSTGEAASGPKKSTAAKPPSTKPVPSNPAQKPVEAKPGSLPKADIDSHDSRYMQERDGKVDSAKIEANGKPVTLLYLPPHMFTIIITRNGQQQAYLTFGTMTASSDAGNRLEVHILARPVEPSDSKFERVAMIGSDTIKKGQSWTKSGAGMDLKIDILGFGEWSESAFPGTGAGWIKLKISAQ